jgi:sugar lactone lactonase YvrE
MVYQRTYGFTGEPYLTESNYYNSPSDVAVATDGSMYITEENGHRLIKRNADGTEAWTIGAAGVKGDWDNGENDRLNNPGEIALSAAGKVYVADRYHGRVQVYNHDGTYAATLGGGTGNYSFWCPSGLTIDQYGYIYVTDGCRQRVQIFNSLHVYVGTLGVTDVSGSDNVHFNNPSSVAVDGNGFIYVADSDNLRVQVFNSSSVYMRTLGVTGVSGDGFGFFAHPDNVAVDSSNRLYVSDTWNQRVQVFDASGAYLTTIGGAWGSQSGMLRNPRGLSFDKYGALYVADWENHRIQKFTIGTPGWAQVNLNGFGDSANRISTLGIFGNQLYAGTYNFSGNGAQLWRSTDGENWSNVFSNGFGNATNVGIDHLIEFNGRLYAGIWNATNTGYQWRTDLAQQ